MRMDALKTKALALPLSPGVYLMKDRSGRVIYVGKAKKLKNRVCQYFQDTASHSPKTRLMVSNVDHFDVIVAASEFEALVLECSLIKRHMPKYNILLKDDKGYPYLRLESKLNYPEIKLVSRMDDDGAEYFGPFGSRGVTNKVLKTIRQVLKLPDCAKHFPVDIGKDRPCLNFHMNQCEGWCQGKISREEYLKRIELARQLLTGKYKSVTDILREQMLEAADNLNFELATELRDRLRTIEVLSNKQLVTAGKSADTDIVGYGENGGKACFSVLHYSEGSLLDKDYQILPVSENPDATVCTLVKQYYFSRGFVPRNVLLPCQMEDADLFSQLMAERFGKKTRIWSPQRGDNLRLVELANVNAREEALRATNREERLNGTLKLLGKMLQLPQPSRIESYDISNISGTDTVGSMVVFQNGRLQKGEYKRFKIDELPGQDDYAAMRQVLCRRFSHYSNQDKGFAYKPDLLLIDGGENHAAVANSVLSEFSLDIPVFGMVKDDRHRTRALVTADGKEIRIDANQSVFSLIGSIQEETHRFAITYHRKLRTKRLRYSELDKIDGIGTKRKQDLLKRFKSLAAISAASLEELEIVLPKNAAYAVYQHFAEKRREE